MIKNNKKRLGDLLVQSGKITIRQLQDALVRQRTLGKKLGELLIDENLVTEEDIINTIETQTGIKRIELDSIVIDKAAIKSLPQSICLKNDLIPIGFKDNRIQIVMSDPLNIFAIDDVAISTGFEVETFIAVKDEIRKAVYKYYSDEQVLKAAQELSKEREEEISESISSRDADFDDIRNAPVVKMVDYLIKNAVEARASDIHIEPFEKIIRIRYRIDGELQEVSKLSSDSLASLVTRIKILANLNIAEKRLPQDGRILIKQEKGDVDLRVSILPTVFGEKVVIRILSRDNYSIGMDMLGMNEYERNQFNNIIKSPHGIILVTGPTGSGKSTTLYSVLNELNTVDKNIVTVEDPVEYTLKGINQVNVNAKAGLTFASGLRSILRQDPDIVMIGEIRDVETAEIAIRAAITGHLVLSTLHTNDAPSTIMRLVDMGIQSYLVATSLSGVIAQRLVRKICPKCKEAHMATDYEKRLLGVPKDQQQVIYNGRGCVHCNNTGYSGRRGVYEIMEVTREHRNAMINFNDSQLLKDISIKNGMKTLGQSCGELVKRGETTIEELVKIAYIHE
ncbi:GspE/PulE family protein [Clostridium oryzae]|uniref:Type II secretion system protein E n=1 Tax=Clostridium oryzae TaxID=1450648 RepID=A0A1V4INA2_9CLOT|nr:ATPase, T2SS/T4P/T4SS family [Clostridium oryzae]OPJ61521.1 type II secretion system protein E [Clostridium oryzae]